MKGISRNNNITNFLNFINILLFDKFTLGKVIAYRLNKL